MEHRKEKWTIDRNWVQVGDRLKDSNGAEYYVLEVEQDRSDLNKHEITTGLVGNVAVTAKEIEENLVPQPFNFEKHWAQQFYQMGFSDAKAQIYELTGL